MRSFRSFTALLAVGAVALAACGSSSGTASKSAPKHGGMTDAQMQCMDSAYAAKHHELCVHGAGAMHSSAPQTAQPLSYTPDGLIDASKVDLSGVPGVTPTQQKAAEDILIRTIKTLPKWSDQKVALADGFQSIGDGLTGEEHLLHWDWIDDSTIFDPEHPESLVYKVDRATGTKTLEAAMYIMPKQYTLQSPPAIASNLMQFHYHDNLCFGPAQPPLGPQVRGLTNAQGGCNPPLTKFNPNIQVHVWIRANDCGPFAALLGVGAGQIQPGQQRACDHDHGKLSL